MALDFPANPTNGQVYDNFYYDSSMQTWRALTVSPVQQIPAGVISQYAGDTAPGGYLLCTGQSLATADYPALFSAIGYTYGGSGSSFTIPNLQNKVPVAKGSGTFSSLGSTGGAETVTLTETNIPGHTHNFAGYTNGESGHSHGITGISGLGGAGAGQLALQNDGNLVWYRGNGTTWASGQGSGGSIPSMTVGGNQTTNTGGSSGHNHYYSGTTSYGSGGGIAHNNLQPYIVLNYIIKT